MYLYFRFRHFHVWTLSHVRHSFVFKFDVWTSVPFVYQCRLSHRISWDVSPPLTMSEENIPYRYILYLPFIVHEGIVRLKAYCLSLTVFFNSRISQSILPHCSL